MPKANQEVVDFLLKRRSCPAKVLTGPAPDDQTLHMLLTAAARSPDHGKLEPWRFLVLEKDILPQLAAEVEKRTENSSLEPEKRKKTIGAFANAPLIVAVIASPVRSDKIPNQEQMLSAGAVCLALVNAALAAGWGANWLSGWPAYDADFCQQVLGLTPEEFVAGFIHIGSCDMDIPDRPRPDIDAKVTRLKI